jgi:hypothetical protein
MVRSKSETAEVQNPSPVPLTADLLKLLLTQKPDHAVLQWFFTQIRAVKDKRSNNEKLSLFETSLMSIVTKISPKTTDEMLISMLGSMTLKDLIKLVPRDVEILNSMPTISRKEYEQMNGMLMSLDGVNAQCILYGDSRASLDEDRCIVIILTTENANDYIVKTPSGIYALRNLSSAITQGGDVSTLILMEGEDGKLVPVEIRNFYLDKEGKKVYVKEDKGKVVHLDGTVVLQPSTFQYGLLPAKSPQLLERYAILCTTGIMDEKFRERLSLEAMCYTLKINQGKWWDLIHYIIRWGTDTLTELSVLLHMLRTINAPQSLIARIEALKKTRDELFEAMKQPNAITQEFMQKWVSMLHEMFALGLHTPDVLAFMQRNGDINCLTEEQTQKIQRYLQSMYMSRLSFFKAIVFRLCQITYGLFVCIPENKHMIYIKAELAEKVLPVLHEKGIDIPIDTLVALLHRNYSLPSDIRLTSSMHLDFEEFVLGALAVLFPHFTGQELCQREKGEPVSWNLIAPVTELVPVPEFVPAPELVQETLVYVSGTASSLEAICGFVKDAKNNRRVHDKPWLNHVVIFFEWINGGRVNKQLAGMLMEIAKCDDILTAIANVAKSVSNGSQPQRIEALIILLLTNFFGHGKDAFIAQILTKVKKGEYDPTSDINELPGRITKLNQSLQAPAPASASASASALAPAEMTLYKKFNGEIYATIGGFKRGLVIMAVFDDMEKVIVVVQNEDVFHVSPLPEGTLCIMSYTHPALSRELLSSMTHRLTTPNFRILGTIIPETTIIPFAMTKKQLSYQELHNEVVSFLASQDIHTPSILRFGSTQESEEEKRDIKRDVDYRVLITEGERKSVEFTASDGTKCDLSFTTLDKAKTQHEVLIAMLLGSTWMDVSGNKVEPFGVPSTLKESLQVLLPVVGIKIHMNSLKSKDGLESNDEVKIKDGREKTFHSVKLMVALMEMVIGHEQYPRYDPYVFFPEGFNKDAFVQFLTTSGVNCAMVVDLFTKAQYCITKDVLKAQESKYTPTLDALPAPLKQLMVKFKEVTTKSFPNSSDKKGVSGVRTVLEHISKQ